ncbi:type II secretion system F family protein [Vibrio pectenicida]
MMQRYTFLMFFFIICVVISFVIISFLENVKIKIIVNKIIDINFKENNIKYYIIKFLSKFYYNREEIEGKLNSAGIYYEWVAQCYYIVKVVLFVLSLIIISMLLLLDYSSSLSSLLYLLASLFVFVIYPDMYIDRRAKKNINHISSRLPFLLDLMNVCVQTGMTIESSLEYLSKELKTVDIHLARVVSITAERSKLVGLQKSLEEFYKLVPTSESQSFVMTLIQSLQFGSSIGAVLSTLSKDIREINIMTMEEKIGKMGSKMSIPLIVFIMAPIVILITAPGIMRMLMQ